MAINTDYLRSPEGVYNVMYLDEDPMLAAKMHSDAHVAKGLVWAAQVLSMTWYTLSLPHRADVDAVLTLDWEMPKNGNTPFGQLSWSAAKLCGQRIYYTGHNAHPCIQWCEQYGGNYDWLYRLACALLEEYKLRFDRIHSTTPVIRALELLPPRLLSTAHKWCDAPAVLPSEFQLTESVDSYRAYYRKMSPEFRKYTNRQEPEWMTKSRK